MGPKSRRSPSPPEPTTPSPNRKRKLTGRRAYANMVMEYQDPEEVVLQPIRRTPPPRSAISSICSSDYSSDESNTSDECDAHTPEVEYRARLFRRTNYFDNPDWSDADNSSSSFALDMADYPPSPRTNIDSYVPMTFEAMPPLPPELKLSKSAAKKASKAAKETAEMRLGNIQLKAEGSAVEAHPKKGHGFGLKSSAQKFHEKAKALKDLEKNSKNIIEEPDPVTCNFNASINMAHMTRRELQDLQEARKMVEKHDGKDVQETIVMDEEKNGSVKQLLKMDPQETRRKARRRGRPKRSYVFQNGKPVNPRRGETAEEDFKEESWGRILE